MVSSGSIIWKDNVQISLNMLIIDNAKTVQNVHTYIYKKKTNTIIYI